MSFRVRDMLIDFGAQMQEEMKQKELERLKAANMPIHQLPIVDYGLDYYPS
jgi:hypothetical protein